MAPQLQTPPPQKITERIRTAFGAFGISIFIHIILFLLLGSYVVFEGIPLARELPQLVNDSSVDISEDDNLLEEDPEITPPSQEMPTLSESTAATIAPSLNVPSVITNNLNLDFSHPISELPMPMPQVGNISVTQSKSSNIVRSKMTSYFGSKQIRSNVLTGYLYDLKQTDKRRHSEMWGTGKPEMDQQAEKQENGRYVGTIQKFIKNDWNPDVLKGYYRSKNSLGISQFFIPYIDASQAPRAFGLEKEVKPKRWVIHYKGAISPPKTGVYRFVGFGDDVLVVRFKQEVILDASLRKTYVPAARKEEKLKSTSTDRKAPMVAGIWVRMEKGTQYPLEVLLGELPGGRFCSFLFIQEKDAKYRNRSDSPTDPLLPVFQTQPTQLPSFEVGIQAPDAVDGIDFTPGN